jgi:hypothetical protein
LGINKAMSPVAADDWRLQGQERYLLGATLKRMVWSSGNPENDHDHCEICTKKLASAEIPDSIQEGYSTLDRYH